MAECLPSEVELFMEDGEVDDGDDDLHDGDEGGDEHRAPLLDAPCQQHERHAAADHALKPKSQSNWNQIQIPI